MKYKPRNRQGEYNMVSLTITTCFHELA